MSIWSWILRRRGAVLSPVSEAVLPQPERNVKAELETLQHSIESSTARSGQELLDRLQQALESGQARFSEALTAQLQQALDSSQTRFNEGLATEMEALRKELRQEGRQRQKQSNAAETAIELLRQSVERPALERRSLDELERAVEEQLRRDWLKDLLSALDGLDSGLRQLRSAASESATHFVSGFEMSRGRLLGILRRHGVELIPDGLGQPLDPSTQRAVGTREDASVPAGTVVESILSGYRRQGQVLRPAEVVVARDAGGTA